MICLTINFKTTSVNQVTGFGNRLAVAAAVNTTAFVSIQWRSFGSAQGSTRKTYGV